MARVTIVRRTQYYFVVVNRVFVIKNGTRLPNCFWVSVNCKFYSLFTIKSSCACAVEGIDQVMARGAILARVSSTVIDVLLAVEAIVPIRANAGVRHVFVGACATVLTGHIPTTLVDVHTSALGYWIKTLYHAERTSWLHFRRRLQYTSSSFSPSAYIWVRVRL